MKSDPGTVVIYIIAIQVLGTLIPHFSSDFSRHLFANGRLRFKQKNMLGDITLPEANNSPLKIGHAERKLVFQPSICGYYVRLPEGTVAFGSLEFPQNKLEFGGSDFTHSFKY